MPGPEREKREPDIVETELAMRDMVDAWAQRFQEIQPSDENAIDSVVKAILSAKEKMGDMFPVFNGLMQTVARKQGGPAGTKVAEKLVQHTGVHMEVKEISFKKGGD